MKRREFLHATAACSTLALAGELTAADDARRIKVGQHGTKHAHAAGQMQTLQKLSNLYEVVGVVEPDDAQYEAVANQAAYRGVPRLTEKEMLSTAGLEVVAVETEVRDLLTTAQRCIDAGFHIHVDKPAGESLPDLRRLHQAAAAKSLTIQMGYMYRYNPAFEFMFTAVSNGWLGNVFEVHAVMSKKVSTNTRRELAKYPGGSMFELGCHLIDPLLHLMGTPDNVISFNRKTIDGDPLLDNTFAVFEYPHATASVRSALVEVDGFRRRQFVVCGHEGTITIRPLEPPKLELTLERNRGDFDKGTHTLPLPASAGRYHGAWNELASVLRGERKFPYSHEHDIAVQRAVLTASGLMSWKNDN